MSQQPPKGNPAPVPPSEATFKAVGDFITLDAELLKSAMALLYNKPLPQPLADLLGANPQVDMAIGYFLQNYPAHIACVFAASLGYMLHVGASQQSLMRSRTTGLQTQEKKAQ